MLKKSLFAAAILAASAQAASATNAPGSGKVTYAINFVGHCDGMTLNVFNGVYATGNSTGCRTGLNQGLYTTVKNFNGLVVTGGQGTVLELFTYALNFTTHKYTIYVSDGATVSVENTGFFTIGTSADADAASKAPSTSHVQ